MFGDYFAQAIIGMLIVCALATAAVTTALIFGVPWLWRLVKPYLHLLTA